MKTFGKSKDNEEDHIPASYDDNAPDISVNALMSFMPDDLKQTFFDILSLNGMSDKFDYTRLLDPLSIQTDTLDPQKSHEVLKLTQVEECVEP